MFRVANTHATRITLHGLHVCANQHQYSTMPLSNHPAAPYPWQVDFFLLAAIWGASFLFMHQAAPEFGPLGVAAGRVGIAALLLMPLALLRGQGAAMCRHWRAIVAVGLFNAGIPFVCYAFALLYIPTGITSILNATTPMFTTCVAWLWLGRRPGKWRLLGLLIGFAGVALLTSSKGTPHGQGAAAGSSQLLAMAACLVATLCYGIAASASKKYLSGVPALAVAAGSNLGAFVLLLAPTLVWGPRHMPSQHAWLALLAVGVFCTGIAYALYYRMIQTTGPAIASATTYLVPVFALAYGYIFLHERITPAMLGYGAVIALGTALTTLAPAGKAADVRKP